MLEFWMDGATRHNLNDLCEGTKLYVESQELSDWKMSISNKLDLLDFAMTLSKCSIQVVQALLQFDGFDVNRRDERGTILHRVLQPRGLRLGTKEILRFVSSFLQVGADMNAKSQTHKTPLCLAIILRDSTLVAGLLSAGADATARDIHNNTTVMFLCSAGWRNFSETSTLLAKSIQAGVDVNLKNEDGNSTIHALAETRWSLDRALAALAAAGVKINVKNNDGQPPLHVAACVSNAESLSHFLQAGADLNAIDHASFSVLDLCIHARHVLSEVVLGSPSRENVGKLLEVFDAKVELLK